jgi:hypothetical protein
VTEPMSFTDAAYRLLNESGEPRHYPNNCKDEKKSPEKNQVALLRFFCPAIYEHKIAGAMQQSIKKGILEDKPSFPY